MHNFRSTDNFFRPLFRLLSFFSHSNINYTNWKEHRWCAWIRTRGHRMIGADETMELWQPWVDHTVSSAHLVTCNWVNKNFSEIWVFCFFATFMRSGEIQTTYLRPIEENARPQNQFGSFTIKYLTKRRVKQSQTIWCLFEATK